MELQRVQGVYRGCTARAACVTRPLAKAMPVASSAAAKHDACQSADIPAASGQAVIARRSLLHQAPLLLSALSWVSFVDAASAEKLKELPRSDMPMTEEGKVFLLTDEEAVSLTLSEKQILSLNQRIQLQTRVPKGFPQFVRLGFDVKVIAPGYKISPEGIIYYDFEEGSGPLPVDGQEVIFNYTGYNESGTSIDSSYRTGQAAQAQLGLSTLIPGFEMALRTMKAGGVRRFIVPPALGPPVGPSTFFSAKQCEVFDVEMLQIKTCSRQQMGMFSKVVCE